MGVDIYFAIKTSKDLLIYEGLSRDFCHFVFGPNAYGRDSELRQIECLLNVDLAVLGQFASTFPPIEHLEHDLLEAQEENDKKKIVQVKRKIARITKEWERDYASSAGWTKITDLERVVLTLKAKMEANPDFHRKLDYTTDWGEYFTLGKPKRDWDCRLYLDLKAILASILKAKSEEEQYATFKILP